jgi:hypothetical protein
MKNKTFGGDQDFQFNACVGNNGWVDLSTYSDGFDEAVNILSEAVINERATMDILVYPLVFSARHRIELFIKSQLRTIGNIRKELKISDETIIKTHDLKALWEHLERKYSICDTRYKPFIETCRKTILEFHQIDPKGETFRYPYNQEGIKHLTEQSVIGLRRFINSYRNLTKVIQQVEHLSNSLVIEYSTGTFTKNLSRKDLEDIANELPDRDTWARAYGDFDAIKASHLARYKLSGRRYSEALRIIQSHREFSSLIGKEITIPFFDTQKFRHLISLRTKLNKVSVSYCEDLLSDIPQTLKNVGTLRQEYQQFLDSGFSNEELATAKTLHELGDPMTYSEDFDYLIRENLDCIESNKPSEISYMASKANLAERIERALRKLGQISFLNELKDS